MAITPNIEARREELIAYLHTLGSRLRRARERQGWSQKQLEGETGLLIGTLSKYERGIREPGSFNLSILCTALDVSADQILDI